MKLISIVVEDEALAMNIYAERTTSLDVLGFLSVHLNQSVFFEKTRLNLFLQMF
jgi:hypothetical protein